MWCCTKAFRPSQICRFHRNVPLYLLFLKQVNGCSQQTSTVSYAPVTIFTSSANSAMNLGCPTSDFAAETPRTTPVPSARVSEEVPLHANTHLIWTSTVSSGKMRMLTIFWGRKRSVTLLSAVKKLRRSIVFTESSNVFAWLKHNPPPQLFSPSTTFPWFVLIGRCTVLTEFHRNFESMSNPMRVSLGDKSFNL